MRGGVLGVAAALAALGVGCLPLPWAAGGLADELPEGASDARGLVVMIGPYEAAAAASRLGNLLPTHWAEGFSLRGEAALGGGVFLTWDGVEVSPGPVVLKLEGTALVAEVGVSIGEGALEVTGEWTGEWTGACAPIVTFESAQLGLHVSLTGDKLGRVQAAAVGAPTLEALDGAVDWAGCLAAGLPIGAGWEATLGEALSEAIADAMAPDLLAALPKALGLDIAAGIATAVAVDELGAGFARVSVRAHAGPDGGPLTATPEGVAVAFEVGIAVDPHPCMAAAELAPVGPTPLPSEGVAAGGSIALSAGVVERAVAAMWSSGAMCGDHATAGVTLPARDLAHAWPALADLGLETRIGMQAWPRGLPQTGLAVDGEDSVTIATGPMDVDLYGELDGAWVRLATVTVDLDVIVGLEMGATGAVTLEALDARVRGSAARDGLFARPSEAMAELLLAPLVAALVDGRPIARLPARPVGSLARRARVSTGHVVFGT